jgi:hypothetical protein
MAMRGRSLLSIASCGASWTRRPWRAARFPFLILDVYFTSEKFWREVIDSRNASAAPNGWPVSVSEQLMNEMLIFASHTAK